MRSFLNYSDSINEPQNPDLTENSFFHRRILHEIFLFLRRVFGDVVARGYGNQSFSR